MVAVLGVLPVVPVVPVVVVAGSPSACREFRALSRIIKEPEGAWTPGRPRTRAKERETPYIYKVVPQECPGTG